MERGKGLRRKGRERNGVIIFQSQKSLKMNIKTAITKKQTKKKTFNQQNNWARERHREETKTTTKIACLSP